MTGAEEIILRPSRGISLVRWKELWQYRELFYFLVWRDIKIRYKQTFLGTLWALIRPLMGMIVFTLIFNKLIGFSVEGVPYLLFTFCGVVAWNFFAEGVSGASQSLLSNANLISKVYFPRVIIPAAAILSGLVDFAIAFILAVVLMVYFQFAPSITILFLPFFILLTIVTSLGIGFLFSSISVQYRDIAHALPYIIQVMFWITPVGYAANKIPGELQILYWCNPIVCVIEGFRWSMLHSGEMPLHLVGISVSVALALFILGLVNFLRMERKFADVI
ncbi:MAG: ABC transporter permease [Bacteroidota bacterium]